MATATLGAISDADVKVLVDELEEEDMADDDYFIDEATVEHSRLLARCVEGARRYAASRAIGDSEGVDIRWEK